jgi:site-specific DNA-methyltransferase (adenine-specific)
MKDIPDGSIDAIITDPPYGMSFQSNRRTVKDKFNKIKNDDNLDWLNDFIYECDRTLKQNSAIYMFCSWHYIDKFKIEFEKHFKLKNILVWNKNNHGSGDLKGAYAPKHEFILYGHKGRSIFRDKRIADVLDFPKINSDKLLHPTEKNINMLEVFIKNNTDEKNLVLDPFMGSGTTGVACKNLNRNFIGIELDENYFNIAQERING